MTDTTNTTTGGTSNTANTGVGQQTGLESSLSNWVGPYVTEMLGRGQALASTPQPVYTGPLTAGASDLQTQAFQGLAGLTIPTDQMQAFTPQQFSATDAQRLMNPYLTAALQPQIDEARRQSEITNLQNLNAATRANAFGGGRQAIMTSEGQRNLLQNLSNITGQGYKTAYDQAMAQFNREQDLGLQSAQQAQQYGLAALGRQADLGSQQRAIESEGLAADKQQFEEQRDYPYKQVQYMQSLLQGMPLNTQNYAYTQPSAISQMGSGIGGMQELYDLLNRGKT